MTLRRSRRSAGKKVDYKALDKILEAGAYLEGLTKTGKRKGRRKYKKGAHVMCKAMVFDSKKGRPSCRPCRINAARGGTKDGKNFCGRHMKKRPYGTTKAVCFENRRVKNKNRPKRKRKNPKNPPAGSTAAALQHFRSTGKIYY